MIEQNKEIKNLKGKAANLESGKQEITKKHIRIIFYGIYTFIFTGNVYGTVSSFTI